MTAASSPWTLVGLALALAPAAAAKDAGGGSRGEEARQAEDADLIQAAPPPFSDGIFPCSECHTGEGDRSRRTLGFHEEIQERFLRHTPSGRWCLDCHDFENRDVLHLSGGERISFTQSYALCAQCHSHKYRDWRLGIHGKRVGSWDGQKTYLLCVNCHDPHSPRIKPIRPERRPRRPMETR
ncbi:MAG TPA: hypothetical protein VLS93_03080 [Anaeromyxobacteraceae bacterium]|nr:hypothetical protein [Anaeromyxobacteraceae bacterium]